MKAAVAASIMEFQPQEWDACFAGELEAYGYYLAAEQAGLADFTLCYPYLRDDQGRLLAAVPAFLTDYRLDTTVTGPCKRVTDAVAKLFPRLFRLPMACLGSPVGEVCHLGFAPIVPAGQRPDVLEQLVQAFQDYAARHKIGFLSVKDAPQHQLRDWQACLDHGWQRIPSLPTALLALPYADLDGYLASLSHATRKDMRRKLKARGKVRVEWRTNIDDVLPQVMEIYHHTLSLSDLQFEELTPAYFRGVLGNLGDHAACVLYWVDDQLAGFNLVLIGKDRLIDKFIGLRDGLARTHNLYFLSWFENVQFCLDRGIGLYHSGQAEYAVKKRLGCRLEANWLLFRHRNPLANRLLWLVGQLVRVDLHDKDAAPCAPERIPAPCKGKPA